MKFTTAIFATSVLFAAVSSAPVRRDVDASLIPEFGVTPGTNPDGTGNCDGVNGANGKPILIPCACPPNRDTFIADLNANVAAGHAVNNPTVAVSFPSDGSQASQLARIQASLVTLQNLNGPGQGCPASSTTFVAQQQAIQAGTAAPAVAAAPPAAASPAAPPAAASPAAASPAAASPAAASPAAAPAAGGVDVSLVPEFGVTAGANPDGTGNCDGIDNASGQAIKIPCACPPNRDTFIADLNANVAAGHATNNPSVSLSFPSGSSNAEQAARIEASIITLQNLNGPGQGCPAASTTFSAQLAAVQ